MPQQWQNPIFKLHQVRRSKTHIFYLRFQNHHFHGSTSDHGFPIYMAVQPLSSRTVISHVLSPPPPQKSQKQAIPSIDLTFNYRQNATSKKPAFTVLASHNNVTPAYNPLCRLPCLIITNYSLTNQPFFPKTRRACPPSTPLSPDHA